MRLLASLVLMACASSAYAALTVDAGNHVLLPNTSGQVIAITISGTGSIQGLNFNAQINPDLVTPAAPLPISFIDITGPGTVFGSNNTGQGSFATGSFGGSQFATASTTTVSGTLVDPTGVLAFLTLDTTGITGGGNFFLNLQDTFAGPTDFAGSPGTPNVGTFLGGNISVTAVPEPSSMLLLGLIGGVGAYRASRRRMKQQASDEATLVA